MPIALDPGQTVRYVLDLDKGKKPEPYFMHRRLTVREQDRFKNTLKDYVAWTKKKKKSRTDDEADVLFDEIKSCVQDQLTGWGNMINPATGKKIPFSRGELESLLTVDEIWDVFMGIVNSAVKAVEDQKKSKSRSRSGTGKFAKRARRK